MNKTKQIITAVILSAALLPAVSIKADTVRTNTASEVNVQNVIKQKKNLLHTQLDDYGRPYKSTFIGNDGFQEGKRVGKPEEPTNLKGKWKNQKLDPKTYLWDRGHLVGNQFAGNPSNVSDNIVGQTSYTNQKLMTYFEGGMKSSNDNALDNWLYLHPNYYIEYIVTANYESSLDQYPRSITLRFRGLDKQGKPIRIKLQIQNWTVSDLRRKKRTNLLRLQSTTSIQDIKLITKPARPHLIQRQSQTIVIRQLLIVTSLIQLELSKAKN